MNPEELESCECDGQGELAPVLDALLAYHRAEVLADTAVSNDVPREDA